jgi:hypothetical protein
MNGKSMAAGRRVLLGFITLYAALFRQWKRDGIELPVRRNGSLD